MTADNAAPILVIGAGSWGTALAVLLAGNGSPVLLWGNEPARMAELARLRRNPVHLPDIDFPARLEIAPDIAAALTRARDVLIAAPSSAFRSVVRAVIRHRPDDLRIAWGTKGLEPGQGRPLHELIGDECPGRRLPLAVISGPTFAAEVARGLPTAVTVATNDDGFAASLTRRLHNDYFRVYTSTDIVGVEIGGAVKNVLAIAAGIADGLGFGANTRAALVTRGLAEIMRLGVALGGRRETFMGLAGLGDLVLTCTDDQSRNRRLGLALGRGRTLAQAGAEIGQVIEGVQTAREVAALARARGIDMPIATEVQRVLHEGKDPRAAVKSLFGREQKAEDFS
ncbi:MAG: NAD(P)-dependent glycerol-3-phosphate dehydrogenase [Gammaproteobacteria bacterium]|nr:NAD(P)-dependent glycerol-3-phosphate dehydrogenase [Gammaproteobacteria bacterium]